MVTVRFYAELNDFLPRADRYVPVARPLAATASVKDIVEACGVPHTEIDLLLVNGEPVPFSHLVEDGDRIAAYPVFESFDIASVTRVRPEPLRDLRFVLDGHLGRLARYLRLAGFDAACQGEIADAALADISRSERRVLLTRDRGLLKRNAVTHGYCVRSTSPTVQLAEVIRRFDLRRSVRPFSRCMVCNGPLVAAGKADVASEVPERSLACFDTFCRCGSCRRVYWQGSHCRRLERLVREALALAESPGPR